MKKTKKKTKKQKKIANIIINILCFIFAVGLYDWLLIDIIITKL